MVIQFFFFALSHPGNAFHHLVQCIDQCKFNKVNSPLITDTGCLGTFSMHDVLSSGKMSLGVWFSLTGRCDT